MQGPAGERRSAFKVDVHLGEYVSTEQALAAWPQEIERLRQIGRESKAEKLQTKLERLQELTEGG
jgi:lipid II:glycine glycyltransferase (peptidoglycan interpeptide bridge formation enzyme)